MNPFTHFLVFISAAALTTTAWADFTVLAVGDTGKANKAQYDVAETMARDCVSESCKFAFLLGDNVYDVGISSPTDPLMVENFEKPYKDMPVPFYVTLGNHDYGKYANEWIKGDHQIAYSIINPKYILPSHYYSFEYDDALFIVLDTSRLFHDKDTREQVQFIRDAIAKSKKKWIVAVTHHPYLSNGKHGNAGRYDGVPLPPYSGSVIKSVIEKEICPHAQLILSGHDHSLQTLSGNAKCPKTLFVVSGGGSSTTTLTGSNPAHFQKSMLGFTRLHFGKDEVEVSQVGVSGSVEHTYRHPIR